MICEYAPVFADGQTVAARVEALTAAGAAKVFRETASGAKPDRAQLRKVLAELEARDVLRVTRLDRAGPIHPRPVKHACRDHRQGGWISE